MANLYKWDGTPVPIASSVEVVPLTATENKVYTAPAGKAYSPVTVAVQGGGQASEDVLSPAPAVTPAFAAEVGMGHSVDLGATIGGGTFVVIPRERYENMVIERAIWGRNEAGTYGMKLSADASSGHPVVKAITCKLGYTFTNLQSGTATFSSAAWRAFTFEYSGTSVTLRIVTETGAVESQTVTVGNMSSTFYDFRRITNTVGRCAILRYTTHLSDADLLTLTRQYEPPRTTVTKAELAAHRVCLFTIDDIESDLAKHISMFTSRGIFPTLGVRLEWLGSYVDFDSLLEMKAAGCELAYHGCPHEGTVYAPTYNSDTEVGKAYNVQRALDLFAENGVKINGFIGPNVGASVAAIQNRFLWFRDAGGSDNQAGLEWAIFGSGGNVAHVNHYKQYDYSLNVNSSFDVATLPSWLDGKKADLATTPVGYARSLLCHAHNFARAGEKYDAVRETWCDLLDYMKNDLGYLFLTPTEYYRAVCNEYGETAGNTSLSGVGAVPGAR